MRRILLIAAAFLAIGSTAAQAQWGYYGRWTPPAYGYSYYPWAGPGPYAPGYGYGYPGYGWGYYNPGVANGANLGGAIAGPRGAQLGAAIGGIATGS
ncbi:MAG TPA: hypothetical protein VHZ24_07695 [Pirellulales bacterium]|nr:hypothetical protein [Pirellulales bacterium]